MESFCDWVRRARARLRFRARAPSATLQPALHPAPRAAAMAGRAVWSLRTRKTAEADSLVRLIACLEAAAAEAERAAEAAEAAAADAERSAEAAVAKRVYLSLPSIPEEDAETYFSCSE